MTQTLERACVPLFAHAVRPKVKCRVRNVRAQEGQKGVHSVYQLLRLWLSFM